MAEKDWYGPFGNWTMKHLHIVNGILGGTFFMVAGLIGYDTGRRTSTATTPPAPRWMGAIEWDQIIIGCIAFAYAYFSYRLLKAERKHSKER